MKDIDINWMLLCVRWFHLSAAIVTIGGAAFLRTSMLSAAAETLDDDAHQRFREAVRKRWSRIVGAGIGILLLTGAIQFAILAVPPKIPAIPYHWIFGIKLLAAMGIFFIASAVSGRSPGMENFRRQSRRWLSILLCLAALVVLLSGILAQVRTAQTSGTMPGTTQLPALSTEP